MISRVMSKVRLLAALVLTVSVHAVTAGPGTSNPYGGKRVLVIGIDGVRSDALQLQVQSGNAPNIAGLIANGTVTWNAYAGGDFGTPTQQPTISGAGWSSILTGTWIDRHNVNGNASPPYNQPAVLGSYLVDQAPHFARLIKESVPGSYVSSVSSWNWVEDYLVAAQPTWLDYHDKGIGSAYPTRDADVAAKAVAQITNSDPDVLFLHFDQVDGAGHANGFSTGVPAYLSAITNVDTHIGSILGAINSRPQKASEQWMVIVTTDHGGTGTSHGGQSIEERTIPFIVSGGGVPVGVSTASPGHCCVPATVMRYLGISISPSWYFPQDGFVTGPTFTAARSAHNVQLAWTYPITPVPGATGVEILRNGTSIGSYALSQTSLTDTSPGSGNVVYQLRFSGTNDAGVSASVFVPSAGQLIWDDANPNNNWNTTDANWAAGDTFANGNEVFFTGSGGETVTVDAAGVTPSATNINGSGSYTFSGGSILGGTLAKTAGGALTLSSANGFTSIAASAGPDSQTSGALVPGNTGSLGTGPITLGNTSGMTAIQFPAALGNATFSNNIALSSPPTAVTSRLLADESNVTITLSGILSGGNSNQELLIDNDSGSGDLGKIRLTNSANTFTTSRIRINRGGLVITSDGALGNTANPLTLDVTSNLAGSGLILEGALTLGAGRSITLASQTVIDTQAAADVLNGPVSFGASLVKRGSASLRLNASGTGTSGMSLTEGSLLLGNETALGTGTLTVATTAAASFLDATPLPATATFANPIVLPADTSAVNRTVTMTGGTGRQLELSGIISGGSASFTTLYLNTSLTGDIASRFLLSGNNTFSGAVRVNRGSLVVNSNASLGAATNALTINSNPGASLVFSAPMTFTHPSTFSTSTVIDTGANPVQVNAAIAGTAALTKNGTGTLTLGATNTHTGALTVSDGKVIVNGALATSANAVTVSASGALGGSGTINRPASVSGTLTPGDSGVGTLTIANTTTVNGGAKLAIQLADWNGAAGIGFDAVTTNALAITAVPASKFEVNVDTAALVNFSESGRVFPIISASSAPTGVASDNWTVNAPGFTGKGTWSIRSTGNQLELVYTVSPFVSWTTSKGLSGNAALFTADPDGDGIPNGVEFVLGSEPNAANPSAGSVGGFYSVSYSGGSLEFTYKRSDASALYQVTVEFSTSLSGPWTTAVDPGNASITTQDGSPADTVTVTIPTGGGERLFARLKVIDP